MSDRPEIENRIGGLILGNAVQGRDVTVTLPSPAPMAMAGLPRRAMFIGRKADLKQLYKLLEPDSSSNKSAVVVAAVAGIGGVGKTSLAVRAAHDAVSAGWFSAGVLFIDLHGYDSDERRITADSALATFLVALGVPIERIPNDQAERETLYRSLLAEHAANGDRALIVADNASSAAQVIPLLPGTGPHRVIVTSRHTLADLEGARLIELSTLPADEGFRLLRETLITAYPEDDRVDKASEEAAQVVRLCGGLPLAIRISGALLVADPEQELSELACNISSSRMRLQALDYDGSLAIRAAFDLSYGNLVSEQKRLFRLLSLHPGSTVGTKAAAALADLAEATTQRLLGELRRAHLVEVANVRGRWQMHDLLRLYASERAESDDTERYRADAIDRLTDFYLAHAQDAKDHLDPQMSPSSQNNRFDSHGQALSWLDAERSSITAMIASAYDSRRYRSVCMLALAVYDYFTVRGHYDDWIYSHEYSLEAARKINDRSAEGITLIGLGNAYAGTLRFDEAIECYRKSILIHRGLGDQYGIGRALTNLGNSYRRLRRFDLSVQCCLESLEINRTLCNKYGIGRALTNLGNVYQDMGRFDEALECCLESLKIRGDIGDRYGQGIVFRSLGNSYLGLRRFDEAIDSFRQSLQIVREFNNRFHEGKTLVGLGRAYRAIGDLNQARGCWVQALAVLESRWDAGANHSANQVRALLSEGI